MPTTQTDIERHAIELSAEAFEAFCEDISGMFSVEMECSRQEACTETLQGLKTRFKKLTAINIVNANGALDGTFHLIFDQGGLFTLSGVIVMLPENRILEEIKLGTIKDIESMNDAIKETGNLLVGSWDRIFREGLECHGHFSLTDTFIGKPWEKPVETINLADDEEFIFVPCQMTIGSYPGFNCGAIFSKKIFEPETIPDNVIKIVDETTSVKEQQQAPAETKNKEQPVASIETVEKKRPETSAETTEKEQPQASIEKTNEEKPEISTQTKEEGQPIISTERADKERLAETAKTADEQQPAASTEAKDQEQPVMSTNSKVTEMIQQTVRSHAVLPGQSVKVSLSKCAQDIMEQKVVWCSSNESVQQALNKMHQHDVGYLVVGTESEPEGIISRSDISGAMSPYLRPLFSKWRRPIDDATLKIRLKWIMSRPVRTIKLDTSIISIIETMRRSGSRCLPVINQKGKVEGMVTVFDVFKILNDDLNTSTVGKTLQAPPLV